MKNRVGLGTWLRWNQTSVTDDLNTNFNLASQKGCGVYLKTNGFGTRDDTWTQCRDTVTQAVSVLE